MKQPSTTLLQKQFVTIMQIIGSDASTCRSYKGKSRQRKETCVVEFDDFKHALCVRFQERSYPYQAIVSTSPIRKSACKGRICVATFQDLFLALALSFANSSASGRPPPLAFGKALVVRALLQLPPPPLPSVRLACCLVRGGASHSSSGSCSLSLSHLSTLKDGTPANDAADAFDVFDVLLRSQSTTPHRVSHGASFRRL